MPLAPQLHAPDLLSSAEVVSVAGFTQPPPLAGHLAGLAAGRLGTVVLAIGRACIGKKQLTATTTFASGWRAAHRAPELAATQSGRKSKRRATEHEVGRRKKTLRVKVPEENPPEENGISNRQLYTTFIPPPTPTTISAVTTAECRCSVTRRRCCPTLDQSAPGAFTGAAWFGAVGLKTPECSIFVNIVREFFPIHVCN